MFFTIDDKQLSDSVDEKRVGSRDIKSFKKQLMPICKLANGFRETFGLNTAETLLDVFYWQTLPRLLAETHLLFYSISDLITFKALISNYKEAQSNFVGLIDLEAHFEPIPAQKELYSKFQMRWRPYQIWGAMAVMETVPNMSPLPPTTMEDMIAEAVTKKVEDYHAIVPSIVNNQIGFTKSGGFRDSEGNFMQWSFKFSYRDKSWRCRFIVCDKLSLTGLDEIFIRHYQSLEESLDGINKGKIWIRDPEHSLILQTRWCLDLVRHVDHSWW